MNNKAHFFFTAIKYSCSRKKIQVTQEKESTVLYGQERRKLNVKIM